MQGAEAWEREMGVVVEVGDELARASARSSMVTGLLIGAFLCRDSYHSAMIDIVAINSTLVAQDSALRDRFAELTNDPSVSAANRALLQVLAEGFAAVHERQGNLITLMLQSGR